MQEDVEKVNFRDFPKRFLLLNLFNNVLIG